MFTPNLTRDFTPNFTDLELAELLVALLAGEPLSRGERRAIARELLRMRRALSAR